MGLEDAAQWLRRGGLLVFPTETFYGLGCLACDARAVAHVYQRKGRPVHKPLPLLAGSAGQVDAVADLSALPAGLAAFWPGPLTVLLPARAGLSDALCNADGLVAVRVTSHPLAAALALAAGGALTASSANLSGRSPVCAPADLDAALFAAHGKCIAGLRPPVLAGGPVPAGGKPSTLVEPLSGGRLRVWRAGAVSATRLEAAGFALA